MKFIIALRKLLGVGDLGPDELMKEILEEHFAIPALKSVIELDEEDRERVSTEKRIKDLRDLYAFGSYSKTGWFDKQTAAIAKSIFRSRSPRYLIYGEEDLTERLVTHLLQKGVSAWNFTPENILADNVKKRYNTIAKHTMINFLDKQKTPKKHEVGVGQFETEGDDDSELESMIFRDTKPGVSPFEKEEGIELKKNLLNYVLKRTGSDKKNNIHYVMFLTWLKNIKGTKPEVIVLKQVADSPMVRKMKQPNGKPWSEAALELKRSELKQIIVDFFVKVRGMRLTNRMKRDLKVASAMLEKYQLYARLVLGTSGEFKNPEIVVEEIRNAIKKQRKDNR